MKPNKTRARTILPAIAVSACAFSAIAVARLSASPKREGRQTQAPGQGKMDRWRKAMAASFQLRQKATAAEKEDRLPDALRLYKAAFLATPGHGPDVNAMPEIPRLYDKMGQYENALAGFVILTKPMLDAPGGGDHWGGDSATLVRCADLSMIYGSAQEARQRYFAAAKGWSGLSDPEFSPWTSEGPPETTMPLAKLRGYAYYCAGMEVRGADVDLARSYLGLALSICPKSPLIRFGFARVHPDIGRQEDWLASREASGALRAAIDGWRKHNREDVGTVVATIKNGVQTEQVNGYEPTGVIPTPSIEDPVLLRQAGWIYASHSQGIRP